MTKAAVKLKEYLKKHHLTQDEFADLLSEDLPSWSIRATSVSCWVNGTYRPRKPTQRLIEETTDGKIAVADWRVEVPFPEVRL